MAERGIIVSREAIRLWVDRFGSHFADCIKRYQSDATDKWHVNDVVMPVNGVKCGLWRAVDANGDVVAIRDKPWPIATACWHTYHRARRISLSR